MMIWLLTICISGLLANPFPDENKIKHLEGNMIQSLEEKKIIEDNDDEEGEEYDDKIRHLEGNMVQSLEEKIIVDENDNDDEEGEEYDEDETRMDGSIFEDLGANMTLDRGSNCHPTTNNWKCCSTSSKCDEGEGDCDKDSHCEGTLKCGKNNCRGLYDNNSIKKSMDCCYDPGKLHTG